MNGAASPARPLFLSWSSGKDSTWALHVLRRRAGVEVRGLITTVNGGNERVAMHGVRGELLQAQAEAVGLELRVVELPDPCTNEQYLERMAVALGELRQEGIAGIAFGDLFLGDVRAFREDQVRAADLEPIFPLWGLDTRALAREMIDAGVQATLACVDPGLCPREFAGRIWDHALLEELPRGVDPCGERGEFHTFVSDAPPFSHPVPVTPGVVVERGGAVFADLVPAETRV